MKVLVTGVMRMTGLSSKSNPPKPYDMCRLTYCVPIQTIDTEKRQLTGFGHEVRDVDLESSALPQFKDIKFPAILEIDVRVDPANLRRNICHGLKAAV